MSLHYAERKDSLGQHNERKRSNKVEKFPVEINVRVFSKLMKLGKKLMKLGKK